MRTVTINGVDYPYVWGIGSMLIFENLTGESVAEKALAELSLTKTTVLHYACLRNGSKEFSFSFAEFVQMLNDREVVDALNGALAKEIELWNQGTAGMIDDDGMEGDEQKDDKKKKDK